MKNFLEQIISDYLEEIDLKVVLNKNYVDLGDGFSIVGKNLNQFWGKKKLKGHYYFNNSLIPFLESKTEINKLIDEFEVLFGKYQSDQIIEFYNSINSQKK